jgi:hypothetical protein
MSYPNHICYADQYGMVGDFVVGTNPYSGAVNPAFTDNTPAWNTIMANASAGDTIVLPPGYCGFKSRPNPPPDFVKVTGAGSFTGLVRNYAVSSQEEIFIDTGVQWTVFENLLIQCASGFSGGVAIGHVASSPATASYGTRMHKVTVAYFTADSMFYGGCKISGEFGTLNYGTRAHTLDDCQFRATYYGLQATACNALRATNIICPTGTANPPYGIWMVGVTNNPCTETYVDGTGECSILCYNTKTSVFEMSTLLSAPILDNNCSGVTITAAYMNGTPSLGGSNNHVFANGSRWDI